MDLGATSHASESHVALTSRGSSLYNRKRALTACHVCRARRTRCDNKRPKCSFCQATGAECIRDASPSTHLDAASLKILDRLDDLEHQLQAVSEKLTPHVQHISPALPQERTRYSACSLLPTHIDDIFTWPSFVTLAPSWNATTFGPRQSPSNSVASPVFAVPSYDLEAAISDNALTKFFAYVHVKNPILVEEQVRHIARRVRSNGIGWDIESCFVLLICANGSLSTSFTAPTMSIEEVRRSEAMALFKAAQRRLGLVMEDAGLMQARCLFYAGVFFMSILRPYDAWRMFLQALASCQTFRSLGAQVDRSPTADSRSSDSWAEQSIYWSCWKSECEVRQELGLPDFRSARLSHPQLFPSVPDCDDPPRAWYFYLAEISLWRLETAARRDIMDLTENFDGDTMSRVAELQADLQKQVTMWKQSLPETLSPEHSTYGVESDVLCFVLEGRLTYFHELIFWPFVYTVINHEVTDSIVLHHAANGLGAHLDRLRINQPGFRHRHHGTWLMLRSSARSALLLVLAAYNVPDILPADWILAVQHTIDMLTFWTTDLEELRGLADLLQGLLHALG